MKKSTDTVPQLVARSIIEVGDSLHQEFLKDPMNKTYRSDDDILHQALMHLLRNLGAPQPLVDSLVLREIKLASGFINVRGNLYGRALPLAELGASAPVLGKLAKTFAEKGYLRGLEETTALLHRKPARKEVFSVVDSYVHGAVESRNTELELLAFAKKHLEKREDIERVAHDIETYHETCRNRIG